MKIVRLFFLALLVATPIGAQTEKTTLEPGSLIEAALDNGARDRLMSEYTYRLKITQRQLLRGVPTIGTAFYETYAPTVKLKGETKFILLKIEENGVPVSARRLMEERQRKSEELARMDEEARQQNAAEETSNEPIRGTGKTAYFTIVGPNGIKLSVETILQHCNFEILRTEAIGGRETRALSFRLKPETSLDPSEQWLAKAHGTIWIDLVDKVVMRLSAWSQDNVAQKNKPAAQYESQLMPDGQWLPREGQINGINNDAVFGKLDVDMTLIFSKYERFNADIQDVKITSPQRKP